MEELWHLKPQIGIQLLSVSMVLEWPLPPREQYIPHSCYSGGGCCWYFCLSNSYLRTESISSFSCRLSFWVAIDIWDVKTPGSQHQKGVLHRVATSSGSGLNLLRFCWGWQLTLSNVQTILLGSNTSLREGSNELLGCPQSWVLCMFRISLSYLLMFFH